MAPLYHRALAAGLVPPVLGRNLGVVRNGTYIDGATVIAFDTGPASALLDDFMRVLVASRWLKDSGAHAP